MEKLRQALEIEAALERVRIKALGMEESEDLFDVSDILFEEFWGMGTSPWRTAITIWNEAEDQWRSWVTRAISSKPSSAVCGISPGWTKPNFRQSTCMKG